MNDASAAPDAADDEIVDYSTTLKSERIKIDGVLYTVNEMSSPERDRYLTQHGNNLKMNAEGRVLGFKSFDGFQTRLIEKCLRDSEGRAVSAKVINGFPASLQTVLHKKCQKINILDDESAEKEKND